MRCSLTTWLQVNFKLEVITKTRFPSPILLDIAAVSIFDVILVELTNTVFVNSTNITTNIETAALSSVESEFVVRNGPLLVLFSVINLLK